MRTIDANGAKIPAIGLGTWPMTGEECAKAVSAALSAGYRHVDTAKSYGNEDAVGEGIRASGVPRGEVFVTTKVPAELAGGAFVRALEGSLDRLGVDYVDLALIHWPSRHTPMKETIGALNDVRRRGLARHIGVSNFTVQFLADAWAVTTEPLAANQCEYHPYLKQDRLIAATRAKGMAFVAYCPVGRGLAFDEPAIRSAAARHRMTPGQVVLAWELQQDGVAVIPKSGDPRRIKENLAAAEFTLDADEMKAIDALTRERSERICPSSWVPWD